MKPYPAYRRSQLKNALLVLALWGGVCTVAYAGVLAGAGFFMWLTGVRP